MIRTIQHKQSTLLYRTFSAFAAFTFIFSSIIPSRSVQAQGVYNLPTPGTMIPLSVSYNPAIVAGITIYPDNPLKFDFIIDTGDDHLQGEALRKESQKLISYFMATLTVPEDEMWVNLSPYENDRIIADGLGNTIMGRDMLVQDYILKQLTASMMYPEDELGSEFWQRVYKKAQDKFGTTEIPTNTFNKIWIVPEEAVIYANGTNIFIADSHLKVMMEEDYLALEHHDKGLDVYANDMDMTKETKAIIKEILLPEIEREVNEGKNFANLRQIYHSMILATWYKNNLKESLLGKVYVNQNKVNGVDVKDKDLKNKIYNQYIEAFKKGVYNYIKEDYDSATQQIIPRKYFSGGVDVAQLTNNAMSDAKTVSPNAWLRGILNNDNPDVIVITQARLGRSSSPINAATLTNYLTSYNGQTLAIDSFVDELNQELSSLTDDSTDERLDRDAFVSLLEQDEIFNARATFSPSAIRMIGRSVAKGILSNRKPLVSEQPILGELAFDDDVSLPENELLTFYHPLTGDIYRLSFAPKEDGSKEVYFYVHGRYSTGHVLMGYSEGELGTDKVDVRGDIPEELIKFIQFFQINVPYFNGNMTPGVGYNWYPLSGESDMSVTYYYSYERFGEEYATIKMELYKGPNGKVEISSKEQRLTVNLSPKTQNDPDKEVKDLYETTESELYWRNSWTNDNVNYRGKLAAVYEKMIDEGRMGNTILELGGGNDPLSAHLRDRRVVSLDIGVPEPVARMKGSLFVKADVENLDGLSEAEIAAIEEFLGIDTEGNIDSVFQTFDTVVISNLLHYVDAKSLLNQLIKKLKPGTTIIVQNDVAQGHKRAFSPKGMKSNKDIIESFSTEDFDIKHTFGYIPQGGFNPHVIQINDEPSVLEELDLAKGKEFDGTLYLIVEKKGADADRVQVSSPIIESDKLGGIDFNAGNLSLKEQGQAIDINFTNVPNIQPNTVNGVTPVIINITPVVNFPLLLGESQEQSDEFSLSRLN